MNIWSLVCLLNAVLNVDANIKHFSYRIVKRVHHPTRYFTQGFTFRMSDGLLLEGTGGYGDSVLALYDINEDGSPANPQDKIRLPGKHFGEGITEFMGKIYQATWQDRKIYTWDPHTFEKLETRSTPSEIVEGWGLSTSPDHKWLMMTEGSAKIFFAYPDSSNNGGFMIEKELIAKDCVNKFVPITGLNELETVPLKITHPEEIQNMHSSEGAPNFENVQKSSLPVGATLWANIYGTQCVVILDADTGDAKAYLHLDDLNPRAGEQNLVTNGIGYRDDDESIWVTGKNWNEIFQIELVELASAPSDFPSKCKTSWRRPHGVSPKRRYPENICPKEKLEL